MLWGIAGSTDCLFLFSFFSTSDKGSFFQTWLQYQSSHFGCLQEGIYSKLYQKNVVATLGTVALILPFWPESKTQGSRSRQSLTGTRNDTRGGGDLSIYTLVLNELQRSRVGGVVLLLCNYPESPGANPCGWHECLPPSFAFLTHTRTHTVPQHSAMCLQYGRSWSRGLCISLHLRGNGTLARLSVRYYTPLFLTSHCIHYDIPCVLCSWQTL